MSLIKKRLKQRERRAARVHRKIRTTTAKKTRLSIFRSLKHVYAQVINDSEGKTVCACSTAELKNLVGDKKAKAKAVGLELAKRATAQGIKDIAFDRGSFLYHGRIQAFAEGAREGGLQF